MSGPSAPRPTSSVTPPCTTPGSPPRSRPSRRSPHRTVGRLRRSNAGLVTPALKPRALEERWILARLEAARDQLEDCWRRFDFASSASVLSPLTLGDLCD